MDPYDLDLETPDTVRIVAEDGGFLELYTGDAEKTIGFEPEEGTGPTDSNFIELTVKKGAVKNANDINEFLFEDGGYSVDNAIGLIFFGVESEEGKYVSVEIEYTSEEQKADFLKFIETLELL